MASTDTANGATGITNFGSVTFDWAGDKSVAALSGDPPRWTVGGGAMSDLSAADIAGHLNREFDPLSRYRGPQYGQFAARVVHEAAQFLKGTAKVPDIPTEDGVEY